MDISICRYAYAWFFTLRVFVFGIYNLTGVEWFPSLYILRFIWMIIVLLGFYFVKIIQYFSCLLSETLVYALNKILSLV